MITILQVFIINYDYRPVDLTILDAFSRGRWQMVGLLRVLKQRFFLGFPARISCDQRYHHPQLMCPKKVIKTSDL